MIDYYDIDTVPKIKKCNKYILGKLIPLNLYEALLADYNSLLSFETIYESLNLKDNNYIYMCNVCGQLVNGKDVLLGKGMIRDKRESVCDIPYCSNKCMKIGEKSIIAELI